MMARTEAIVLKKTPHRENDWRVCFFTRDFGKIEAVAVGARKIKSKLAGHLALPGIVEIVVSEGKSGYKLTQAHLIEQFAFEKNINFIFSLLEVLEKTLIAPEKGTFFWKLTIWALRNVQRISGNDEKQLFLNIFLLRWINLSGYKIEADKWLGDLSDNSRETISIAQEQPDLTMLKLAREENRRLSLILEKYFCDTWEKKFYCLSSIKEYGIREVC